MKRRYTVDSDEDGDYREDEEHVKRPRTQQADSAEEDAEGEGEEELNVEETAPPSLKPTKQRLKHSADVKKRRLPVASEPDTEDEYMDPEDNDDNFAVEPDRPLKGKGRASLKVAKQSRGIPIKKAMAKTSDGTVTGAGKRSRPKAKGEDDGAGESVPTPDTSSINPIHSPPSAKDEAPPPKKRKLPTIKKNKSAASAGPVTPSTASTVAKPAPPPAPKGGSSILDGSLLPARKPTASTGPADFDLRNQDVYNALFKNVSCCCFFVRSSKVEGLDRRVEARHALV